MVDSAQNVTPATVGPTVSTPAPTNPVTPPQTHEIEGVMAPVSQPIQSSAPPMTLDAIAGNTQAPQTQQLPEIPVASDPQPVTTPALPSAPAAVAPQPNLPNVDAMQQALAKNEALLPELPIEVKAETKVDHSPLAALQPQALKQQPLTGDPITGLTPPPANGLPPLPSNQTLVSPQLGSSRPLKEVESSFTLPELPYGAIIGLILLIQAAIAILQLMHFAMAQYPSIEQSLLANQLAQSEVVTYWFKSSVLGIATLITLVIGGALLLTQPSSRKKWITLGGVAILCANLYIQNVFVLPQLISGNPLDLTRLIQEIQAKPASTSSDKNPQMY